ncbi:MAG: hypothetical protein ABSE42_20070 [Bryobacteraceae bacterium]|jgi:hypothetical protein
MKLTVSTLTVCLLALTFLPIGKAQGSDANDIELLKAKLAEQQKQIEVLRQSVDAQQKLIERLTPPAAKPAEQAATQPAAQAPGFTPVGGAVASTTGALPDMSPVAPSPKYPVQEPPQGAATSSPLQIQLGNVTIMPVGFMDATAVWRNEAPGSGIGSSFGSIPFSNAVPGGKLEEFRFSPQNSRLGFRVDGDWKGFRFMGYNEFDFLGTSGSNAIGVTNGAFVPRLRLFWVNVRKGPLEFLGGQSWSMLTPNRKGISALPSDIFFSQVVDVNYMLGLTWTRQPGFRFLLHAPKDVVTWGISFENPNQYMGGSGGGPQITLPSALSGLLGTQLDNTSTSYLSTPNPMPDIITKLAFDPVSRVHFELAGLVREFKVYNLTTGQPTSGQTFSKTGVGGSVNGNFEVFKNFRLVTNNFISDGGGRYLFGQAPDLIIRADGSISPIRTKSTVDGFEASVARKTLLYAYFGGLWIGQNFALDANGTTKIGYGFLGSANSQNHIEREYTFGINQTIWKDAKYGAINVMGQYEYLTRNPWYVALNALNHADDSTIYFNVRYTLPGGPPAAK